MSDRMNEPTFFESTDREWFYQDQALILDHPNAWAPEKIRKLARAVFTKEEWAQLKTPNLRKAAIEVKAQIGAEVN